MRRLRVVGIRSLRFFECWCGLGNGKVARMRLVCRGLGTGCRRHGRKECVNNNGQGAKGGGGRGKIGRWESLAHGADERRKKGDAERARGREKGRKEVIGRGGGMTVKQ